MIKIQIDAKEFHPHEHRFKVVEIIFLSIIAMLILTLNLLVLTNSLFYQITQHRTSFSQKRV